MPADGGRPTRLPGDDIRWPTGPQWSKDGTRLCFALVPAPGTSADIFTVRADGTGLVRVTSDPSWESYCHWFDHDGYLWLVSDLPDLGFDFAYYVPSSGGEITLFLRG